MAPSDNERSPLLQSTPSEEPEDPTKLPKGRRNAILVAVWLGVLCVLLSNFKEMRKSSLTRRFLQLGGTRRDYCEVYHAFSALLPS